MRIEVINIFRECCFEYAGKYSGEYNLIMAYVSDSNDGFITGGGYTPSLDSLPALAESVLYSMKYSENLLDFTVEIVNPDTNIPTEQFAEIKDWLFGQDGWKKLTLESEEFQGYYLKCLLIPDVDIVDGSGFRGVKCKVQNISAFWYGEDRVIEYTSEEIDQIYSQHQRNRVYPNGFALFPEIKTQHIGRVYPIVTMQIQAKSVSSSGYVFEMRNDISNDALPSRRSDFSVRINSTNSYTFVIDTKHGIITQNGEKILPQDLNTSYSLLHFYKGVNQLYVKSLALRYLSIKYTPMHRLGGF